MFVYLYRLAETARCVEVTTLLLRLDGYMYGSSKGHLSLTWKIGVCFVENRSLFSKNWIEKSKFALKNGSLNKGVCFRKWEFENGSMFWKMEVCFRKSKFEIENRSCTRLSTMSHIHSIPVLTIKVQGLVVRKVDNSFHWINICPKSSR